MRCLAVKQPWATLAVHGATGYLVRDWSTRHRGPLAIHASSRFPRAHIELCCDPEMRSFLRRCGYDYAMELPVAVVLGTVLVADCVYVTEENRMSFAANDPAVIFGLIRPGRWAWLCRDACVLPRPVPITGRLGIFQIDDRVAHHGSSIDA